MGKPVLRRRSGCDCLRPFFVPSWLCVSVSRKCARVTGDFPVPIGSTDYWYNTGPVRTHFPPWLLTPLVAASGCAALIYEIVWFQLLQLVIGSSAISLGLLLAAYMGGLCLGSALLPRVVPARLHPLRVYAAIELGIGI